MPDENIIDENLEKIEPNIDDFINRRINHIQFAKLLYWLWSKSKKDDFVYVNELSKFTKLTKNRAYSILNDLCNINLLEKKWTGNMAEYWFVKNGESPLINKYIERAKKMLGLE